LDRFLAVIVIIAQQPKMTALSLKALFLALAVALAAGAGGGLGRGWGNHLPWAASLDDGWKQAKEQGKPLVVVVHKTWCGACKALKPRFADSEEIKAAAEGVVLVNLQDEEEPTGAAAAKYAPNGAAYIPRILFFGPGGDELPLTSANPNYAFYYSEPADIAANMRRAAALVSAAAEGDAAPAAGGDEL
jgi:protein-disulfide reductase (glutathione)